MNEIIVYVNNAVLKYLISNQCGYLQGCKALENFNYAISYNCHVACINKQAAQCYIAAYDKICLQKVFVNSLPKKPIVLI